MFKYLIFSVLLLTVSSCRDYIEGSGENTPPSLNTTNIDYFLNDSVKVYLQNNSQSAIYIIDVYDYIERKDGDNWNIYVYSSCKNTCPEVRLASKNITSGFSLPFHEAGTYRFVCLFGEQAGLPKENKVKLYSNRFNVE